MKKKELAAIIISKMGKKPKHSEEEDEKEVSDSEMLAKDIADAIEEKDYETLAEALKVFIEHCKEE